MNKFIIQRRVGGDEASWEFIGKFYYQERADHQAGHRFTNVNRDNNEGNPIQKHPVGENVLYECAADTWPGLQYASAVNICYFGEDVIVALVPLAKNRTLN